MIRQRLSCIGFALALPLLVMACSDDAGGSGSTSATVTTPPGASDSATGTLASTTTSAPGTAPSSVPSVTTTVPVAVVDVKVQPGTGSGFEGALKDVTDMRCESVGGVWSVSGNVTNPTAGPVNYRVYVSFVDDTAATPGLLEVDSDNVAAGATAAWTGSLEIGLANLKCILRVERTPTT